jgi:hypothetical protein
MINLDLTLSSRPVVIQKNIIQRHSTLIFSLLRGNYPRRHAAQPCSYIYPIYSVVKNRLRAIQLQRYGPQARLRHAQVSISDLHRTFKLEQVCFDSRIDSLLY